MRKDGEIPTSVYFPSVILTTFYIMSYFVSGVNL